MATRSGLTRNPAEEEDPVEGLSELKKGWYIDQFWSFPTGLDVEGLVQCVGDPEGRERQTRS